MDKQLASLKALLEKIQQQVSQRQGLSSEAWRKNVLKTIIENVDRYKEDIDEALRTNSPDIGIKAACRVSGMRKGISDLGMLEPAKDYGLIAIIDEADTLATRICISERTNPFV